MAQTPFPSPEELRIKYAYLLDNEELMNLACWNETNTDEPFDAEATIRFAHTQARAHRELTDKVINEICLPK